MNLYELVFEIHQDNAELLSDALLWSGAVSVVIEDANALTELEVPLFGEPGLEPIIPAWALNKVIASVTQDTFNDLADFLSQATDLYDDALPDYALRLVPELDWVRLTQSQFPPIEVSPNLWIIPSWHKDTQATLPSSAVSIELDPGLAFGTGTHPTTHLCLQWLDNHQGLLKNKTVLDYGCGSGILAIAAQKLGAKTVVGIDIDPQAVQASRYNAEHNECLNIQFALPDTELQAHYDVVIANILTNPLKILAPMLCNKIKPNGCLVLSGILERQAEEVIAVYQPYCSNISIWKTQDGWVCLTGQLG